MCRVSLHKLAISLKVRQRLLDRRTIDGTLMLAEPALIEAAIEAGREEVRHVSALLASVSNQSSEPFRRTAAEMATTVVELRKVIDIIELSIK